MKWFSLFLFQDIAIFIFYQKMALAFAHRLCLCTLKLKRHLRLSSRNIKCDKKHPGDVLGNTSTHKRLSLLKKSVLLHVHTSYFINHNTLLFSPFAAILHIKQNVQTPKKLLYLAIKFYWNFLNVKTKICSVFVYISASFIL